MTGRAGDPIISGVFDVLGAEIGNKRISDAR